jgi:hypothetical protein
MPSGRAPHGAKEFDDAEERAREPCYELEGRELHIERDQTAVSQEAI